MPTADERKRRRSYSISVEVPKEIHEALKARAVEDDRSLIATMRTAFEHYLACRLARPPCPTCGGDGAGAHRPDCPTLRPNGQSTRRARKPATRKGDRK